MKVTIRSRGDLKKTQKFLKGISNRSYVKGLAKYGEMGVRALSSATPIDTGLTASSWSYDIKNTKDAITITWRNSNVVDNVPIAIILQYGHGTRNGGYVQGQDYINPAIQPIFDKIADSVWKEVTD